MTANSIRSRTWSALCWRRTRRQRARLFPQGGSSGRFGFEPLERRALLSALPAITASLSQPGDYADDVREMTWLGQTVKAKAGEWIVKFDGIHGPAGEQAATAGAVLAGALPAELASPITIKRRLGADGLFLVTTRADMNPDTLTSELRAVPGFAYAEPNLVTALDSTTPNDPQFGSQLSLNNTGQLDGRGLAGLPDADIDAPEAWDLTHGSRDVVIAVIDTGIDTTHPDLVPNLWTNPGEIPGDGIDNDGNGYVDDIHGWDFSNGDNDPFDDYGHGTPVAGVIGAQGNDSLGITGIAWDVQIMALKAFNASIDFYLSSKIEAVNYATMMRREYGVNVRATSNSYGTRQAYSQAFYDAIAASRNADMLFVASAGNGGVDGVGDNNDGFPQYPASYDLDNIIAVGATDNRDQRMSWSNFGLQTVDLFAAGEGVFSTDAPSRYTSNFGGTSAAAPHVTGVAALAWSLAPTATYAQVRAAIFAGVDPLAVLAGRCVTGGRLNAFKALTRLGLFVADTQPTASQILATPATDFVVDFNGAVDPVSLAGPDLAVNGVPADALTLVDANTVRFHYDTSPVVNQGPQQIALAAGVVTRFADASPLAAFVRTFFYDADAMHVVGLSPADGAVVAPDLAAIDVDFSEPYDSAAVDARDLTLTQGTLTGFTLVDADTVRYFVSGFDQDGPLHVTVGPNKLRDAFGTPMGPFAARLEVDLGTVAVANWSRVAPFGSLIRAARAEGTISFDGDADPFTIALDPGQTLRVLVAGQADLQPSVVARSPSGDVVAQATAPVDAAADTGLIVAVEGGVFTLDVSGAMGSTGAYTVDFLLNAAVDGEQVGGASNDTLATAQDINGSIIAAGGGASRAAVVGRADLATGLAPRETEPNNATTTANDASANFKAIPLPGKQFQLDIGGHIATAADLDWFTLGVLPFASTITVSLSGVAAGRGTLAAGSIELHRQNGGNPLLVASDAGGGPGDDALLYRVPLNYSDIYYVVVRGVAGMTGTYRAGAFLETTGGGIVATGTNATLESESNNTRTTADPTAWRRVAYGSHTTSVINAADVDVFAYQFRANDGVTIVLDSSATAECRLTLRDAAGNPIAAEDGASPALGRSSSLYGFTIPVAGTYYVEVGANGGHGAYALDVHLSSATAPPTAPAVGSGDVYAIELRAGEAATLGLAGSATTSAKLELLDALGQVVATGATGSRSFSHSIANFLPAQSATYYAVVHDAPDTDYRLIVTRGAAFDTEGNDSLVTANPLPATGLAVGHVSQGVPRITTETEPNDSLNASFSADKALANDWSGSFLPLSGRDYRAVLTGTLTELFHGFDEIDVFRILVSPGDRVQITMSGSTLNSLLRLYDNQGRLFAYADSGGTGGGESLTLSTFPYAGDYYVVAGESGVGTQGAYTLTGILTTSQPLGSTNDDFYSLAATPGNRLVAWTETPGDGPGAFANTLNPKLELYSPSGVLVASNDNSAGDGRNALLNYFPTVAGTYKVRVLATAGTSGEYLLHAQVVPATTFIVTNTLDAGPGSLRQAATDANAAPGVTHTLVFAIPGGGPRAIQLTSDLPALNDLAVLRVDAGGTVEIGTFSAFSLAESAGITKTGGGVITIAGAQSHAAGSTLTVTDGTLNLASNAGSASGGAASEAVVNLAIVVTGGTLNITAEQDIRSLAVDETSATVFVDIPSGGTMRIYDGGTADGSTVGQSAIDAVWADIVNGYGGGGGITTHTVSNPALNGLGLALQTDANNAQFLGIREMLLGDINGDDFADADDAALLFACLGSDGAWLDGDLNYDGYIDAGDATVLFSALGQAFDPAFAPAAARTPAGSPARGSATGSFSPEPAATVKHQIGRVPRQRSVADGSGLNDDQRPLVSHARASAALFGALDAADWYSAADAFMRRRPDPPRRGLQHSE